MAAGKHNFGTQIGNNSFTGTFAGLEIYSRALSQTEIRHNYKTQKSRLFDSRGIVLP